LNYKSLIALDGTFGGKISLFGNSISINSGSMILSQAKFSYFPSKIQLFATERILLSSDISNQISSDLYPSLVLGQNLFGEGTNIEILTNNLDLMGGTGILSKSILDGNVGNILINANNIFLGNAQGNAPIPFVINVIGTAKSGTGKPGNIIINTKILEIKDGSSISTGNFGSGDNGSISISASEYITINGSSGDNNGIRSNISTISYNSGNSGNLNIYTNDLNILNGSSIGSFALAAGNAGDISIKANNINVIGFGSSILSSATFADEPVSSFYNLSLPTGNSGNIKIETNNLKLDTGAISTSNIGPGIGGSVEINANNIYSNNSSINAYTFGGNGGDISIKANTLILKNRSQVNTSSLNSGNGGNIDINTIALAGDRSSKIIANAQQGQGGNININAEGIVGLLDENISATSASGVDGEVRVNADAQYNAKDLDFSKLPENQTLPIACDPNGNAFYVIGSDQLSDIVLDKLADNSEIPKYINEKGEIRPFLKVQAWIPTGSGNKKLRAVTSVPVGALTSNPEIDICKIVAASDRTRK
jgi:large exoprotein involved in heme utilization and adhesion